MGLEDFFEQGHKRHGHGHDHGHDHDYGNNDRHYDGHRSFNGHNIQQNDIQKQILEKLQNNPNIKKMLLVVGFGLIVIVLILIVLLFPLIQKLLTFVTENGIQGLVDTVWKGTK